MEEERGDGVMNEMLARIDVVNSDSYNADDKKMIFNVVEEKVGFNTINSTVLLHLRKWVIRFAYLFFNFQY
jgi:hypothetical protein